MKQLKPHVSYRDLTPEQQEVALKLRALLDEAQDLGLVVTVHNVNVEPLAMGNHFMHGSVRRARIDGSY